MNSRHLEEGGPFRLHGRAASQGTDRVLTKLSAFLLRRFGARNLLCVVCIMAWFLLYSFTLFNSKLVTPNVSATYGQVQQLACTSVHWTNANQCGLNGHNCRPFTGDNLLFRCPSNCRGAQITTPVTVGGHEYNFRPLVIGGVIDASTSRYRGDSFICPAAIHAGIISNSRGGCGVLHREGEAKSFPSTIQNGIDSIGFNSSFPLAISFDTTIGTLNPVCGSGDARWFLLIATVLLCSLLPILLKSTVLFFGTVFTIVFFHVALVSDPPDEPHMQRLSSVISAAVGNFLPAAFVAFVLFYHFVCHTLPVKLYTRRTWLWLWATWCGSLCNVAEQLIPLQRLTLRDMQQPGAVSATICISVLLILCVMDQILIHAKEGRLAHYLKFYGTAVILLCAAANLPGLQFRLHHYAWALLLIPGASTRTWRASIYQGLLFGIFINGVARWGFASVLQTEEEVFRAPISTAFEVPEPVTANASHLSFILNTLPTGWSGVNVLRNDVLRYQDFMDGNDLRFDLDRGGSDSQEIFLRFALVKHDHFRGLTVGDYTKPVVWRIDGTVRGLV